MKGTHPVLRHLAAHLVGYLVSTQTWFMIVGHAGWIFLIVITLQDGAVGSGGRAASSLFLDAFMLLGGTDENGRGDASTLMRAFGNLSLLIYGAELLVQRWRGRRERMRWSTRLAIASGCALVGYGVGFAAMFATGATVNGTPGDAVFVACFMALFTTGASAWGLAALDFSKRVRAQILAGPSEHPPAAVKT